MSDEFEQKTTTRERATPLLEERQRIVRSQGISAGPSTTSNVQILVTEAELAAEDGYAGNPHVPTNDTVLEAAEEQIGEKGLTPAWVVMGE